jgi:hypothetical protein
MAADTANSPSICKCVQTPFVAVYILNFPKRHDMQRVLLQKRTDKYLSTAPVVIRSYRSAHRNTRSLSEHSCGNVHGCQLLEEQFGRIWDVNLRDFGLVFARTALERPGVDFAIDKKLVQVM